MFEATTSRVAFVSLILITAGLAGCLDDGEDGGVIGDGEGPGDAAEHAEASLIDAEGQAVGTVSFSTTTDAGNGSNAVLVAAEVDGLDPGFHGFHLHETASCDGDFTDAGSHHAPGNTTHGEHAGDMPVLLVNENGTGELSFHTDRVSLPELLEDDGSAVIVHDKPDNYANIPERYGGPDEDTNATGDAGVRVACGALEETDDATGLEPASADGQADLVDADGEDVGTVTFEDVDEGVRLTANLTGLEAGFHGFHLHERGVCDPDFSLAGGHHDTGASDHGNHSGDLPVLLDQDNQAPTLTVTTDRVTLDELTALDGTAVIVHELADNYANIPERYDGPDEDTNNSGDAGPRVACGPVEAAS